MTDLVRVLRVIEYVGPREWVEDCIRRRGLKGEMIFSHKEPRIIRESIIGETSELLKKEKEEIQ